MGHGGRVLLLDKSPFCGGNSTKATSGINGANTKGQRNLGISDSNDIFLADTLKGGAKKPEVAKVLCFESGPGVDWLVDKSSLTFHSSHAWVATLCHAAIVERNAFLA